jgi:prepilin-type N-terminal cleavage/methylation domain-containing protein
MRNRAHRQAGVTLIELMIAITLVAALSTGLLMAMRTGLITLEKTDARLQSNRRMMGVERILSRQLSGVMPVAGPCAAFFRGTGESLRMVSTYSMTGGARGLPQILEFQVIPAEGGGVRLIVDEHPYFGPASLAPFCASAGAEVGKDSFVLGDHLAYCRISYHESIPDSVLAGRWLTSWDRPNLPAAVRVDMAPLVPEPAKLPLVSVTVLIHITREVLEHYGDE